MEFKSFLGEVFEVGPVDVLENIKSELTNKELDFYVDVSSSRYTG